MLACEHSSGLASYADAIDLSLDLRDGCEEARYSTRTSVGSLGGWAAGCALAGSREQVGNAGLRWQMDGVEPRGVGATRVVLLGVYVCCTASCRRVATIDPNALVR